MAHITREGLETCMAFGEASLAVADVVELLRLQVPDGPSGDLLAELEAAHHRPETCSTSARTEPFTPWR
jgi:hypothetical protein